jgi:hypothetical protein
MAALFSGMRVLVLGIAVALAVVVWAWPKEAAAIGVLFLMICTVIFPSVSRFDWTWRYYQPWQMAYWATGLLIITLAAVARIGIGSLWRIPASVKAFLAVALIATVVGFVHGDAASYVLRQLYGSLLLVAYFAIAYRMGDEELFLRRLRTYGLLCAAGFFIYYAATFSELGFHKEITALATMEGAIGILCFVKGLTEKRRGWIVSALVLTAVPVLLWERRMLVTFAVAVALALAIKTSSRKARYLYLAVALLGTMPGILVSSAGFVLEKMEESVPGIVEALPFGGADVTSLEGRNLELSLGVDALKKSPILGGGFGAQIAFVMPGSGEFVDQIYVDNGWAYAMMKMGGLGLLAFGWFLATMLSCVSRKSLALSACLLSMVLVTMFNEPVFFNFNTSCLLGAMAGLLCAGKARTLTTEVATVSPAGH